MLTKSLKIWDSSKKQFMELIFFESHQKISKKKPPCIFEQCFEPFNMLTVHKGSDTGFYNLLSNSAFSSL